MTTQTILYILIAIIISIVLAVFMYGYKTKFSKNTAWIYGSLRFVTIFSVLLLLINPIFKTETFSLIKPILGEYDWFENLDSVRQEAMIDLSFNLGQTKLRTFVKALGHMADGNYEEAGREFYNSRWAEQVGDRSLEVCQMIGSGEYQKR